MLKRKYDSLQEFVSLNIATDRQERPLFSEVTRGLNNNTPTRPTPLPLPRQLIRTSPGAIPGSTSTSPAPTPTPAQVQ